MRIGLFLPPEALARQTQPLGIAAEQRQIADGPEHLVEQLLVGAKLAIDAQQAPAHLIEQRVLLGRAAQLLEAAHVVERLGQLS